MCGLLEREREDIVSLWSYLIMARKIEIQRKIKHEALAS